MNNVPFFMALKDWTFRYGFYHKTVLQNRIFLLPKVGQKECFRRLGLERYPVLGIVPPSRVHSFTLDTGFQ